jgi:hypothetical protein
MKFIPIAGLLLAIWGLVTWDWLKIVVGLLMFLGGFALDVTRCNRRLDCLNFARRLFDVVLR